jgi:hypothetical protein
MFHAKGCVDVRLAGVKTHYLSPPKDINMRIPDQVIKCVGFISHDQPSPDYLGTVFLVGVKSEVGEWGYCHLVTARHVAEMIDPGPFVIGMNGKDGRKILLKSGDAKWWYHPTEKESVDVAVTPFATAIFDEYDIEWVPEQIFASNESIKELGIGLGDEIFAVGLFTRFFGSSKFVPLVRSGTIAMMPEDKLPVKGYGQMEVYLAEGRSIGGLSGSPVFVRNTANMAVTNVKGQPSQIHALGPQIKLLGLMHGHWEVSSKLKKTEQAEAVNMGVSIIIPTKKIREVLHHPELVQLRKELDKKSTDENSPVQDSAKRNDFTRKDFEDALKKVSRKTKVKK